MRISDPSGTGVASPSVKRIASPPTKYVDVLANFALLVHDAIAQTGIETPEFA